MNTFTNRINSSTDVEKLNKERTSILNTMYGDYEVNDRDELRLKILVIKKRVDELLANTLQNGGNK